MSRMESWVRRIERAEARNAIACAYGRAKWFGFEPEHRWLAGGNAVYAGHWTHLTQAVALGISGPAGERDIRRMKEFFRQRLAVPTAHVADTLKNVICSLEQNGFRNVGDLQVVARSVPRERFSGAASHVAISDDASTWARAAAEGFLERSNLTRDELEIGGVVVNCSNAVRFVRRMDGEIQGTAAFTALSGVGLLFADSTRLGFRGLGVQSALIQARLRYARSAGCDVVAAMVAKGSASERNYLRHGFKRLYSRVTLQADL